MERIATEMNVRNRHHGALFGLAIGDALGTTIEFQSRGTFEPVSDLVGGGPFDLNPGEWTDDTSMALCLAESLLARHGFDARDQMDRYVGWWKDGHLSSNGRCFDIGNTVRGSLSKYLRDHDPFAGPLDAHTAGNGSLMRLAPVPLFFAQNPRRAIELSGDSSRTTHGARAAVDACRFFAGLILGCLQGATKDELLAPRFSPVQGVWDEEPLCPEIHAVASGSYREKEQKDIRGTGYVVDTLEAALWAFYRADTFRDGLIAAVNLGDDADTVGAVYGQLAGAFYGIDALPEHWKKKVAKRELILTFADELYTAAKGPRQEP